jgi:hypothetical protein
MKNVAVYLMLFFSINIVGAAAAVSEEVPGPFNLHVGETSYSGALNILKSNKWDYKEYEKKQFKMIGETSPDRGKNTFLVVTPKHLKGLNGIRLFFGRDSVLDAIIINLEPLLFPVVMDDLDQKYKVVQKKLFGESYSTDYTHVLYEKGNMYIELQKLSAHNVRLVYVSKLLYENYKDFFHKAYESFRVRQRKEPWMKDL